MSEAHDAKGEGTAEAPAPNTDLVRRFARAVREVSERPGDLAALRVAVKELGAAAPKGAARLTAAAGALSVDGAPLADADDDARLLASRLAAYGVEELTITPKVAPADLTDLVRLLATVPSGGDPAAQFAARSAVLDSRTVPLRLSARVPAVAEDQPVAAAPPARRASRSTPTIATGPVRAPASPKEEESDVLREALPVPATAHEQLAAIFAAAASSVELAPLRAALDDLANYADLAFRGGRDDALIESLTGLVAIEYAQLERDSSDDRRQALTHTVRRLARPVLLRHLAVLRHRRASDPEAVTRLQAIFHRFGTDGVDALIDEHGAAPTLEARGAVLSALRGLRRSLDALMLLSRDPQEASATQAAVLLGSLGGSQAQQLLTEMMHHPAERVRRAAIGALSRLGFEAAQDALRAGLGDESPMVRARAVAAIAATAPVRSHAAQGVALLTPLLDREEEREVLYAAVASLGHLGGPEAVQLLIRVAEGGGNHPRRRSPSLRIQGCTALVAIRTPAAMACVQAQAQDRDREVRDAAVRLVAQAQRRTTQSQAVVG